MQENMAPGPVAQVANVASTSVGLEYVGGATLDAPGTVLACTFLPRDGMQINIGIVGMEAAGNVFFRLGSGGSQSTGLDYWYKPFTSDSLSVIATFASPAVAGQNSIPLNVNTQTTDSWHVVLQFMNRSANGKALMWQGTAGSGAANNSPVVGMGSGEWVNTTGQANHIRVEAAANMLAGSSIMAFGRNFP